MGGALGKALRPAVPSRSAALGNQEASGWKAELREGKTIPATAPGTDGRDEPRKGPDSQAVPVQPQQRGVARMRAQDEQAKGR